MKALTTVFRDLLLFQGHVHDPRPFLDAGLDAAPSADTTRTAPPPAHSPRHPRPLVPAGVQQ